MVGKDIQICEITLNLLNRRCGFDDLILRMISAELGPAVGPNRDSGGYVASGALYASCWHCVVAPWREKKFIVAVEELIRGGVEEWRRG